MSPLGKSQENYECSQRNTGDVPRCHNQGKLPVHLQCSRSCDPMGTSQSHDLEHCECTVHVPAGVITGKLSGKFKVYLQCSRWVHCWYTVHFLVMYLQCSWWEHHHLPPANLAWLCTKIIFAG